MKKIKAKVKAVGKRTYKVMVEGVGVAPYEAAEYSGEKPDPELTARQNAGAYVKGYNQGVSDALDAVVNTIGESRIK